MSFVAIDDMILEYGPSSVGGGSVRRDRDPSQGNRECQFHGICYRAKGMSLATLFGLARHYSAQTPTDILSSRSHRPSEACIHRSY